MPNKTKNATSDIEEQVAALPLRLNEDGRLECCLVTSRETRRWVLPKGNLMKGVKRAEAAAIEAQEEAGLTGRIISKPYRHFDYWKRRSEAFFFCRVAVYLLMVCDEAESWKEKGQRERRWVRPATAYHMVLEPGLQSILRQIERDASVVDLLRRKDKRDGRKGRSARALCLAG